MPDHPPPTAAEILDAVAHVSGFTVAMLTGPHYEREVVAARYAAMRLVRRLTPMSYPRIGRLFNRVHSVVLHAHHHVKDESADIERWAYARLRRRPVPRWTPDRVAQLRQAAALLKHRQVIERMQQQPDPQPERTR